MPFGRGTRSLARPAGRASALALAAAVVAPALAACGGAPSATPPPPTDPPPTSEVAQQAPAPTSAPEPTPTYDFMAASSLVGSPQDSPEGTFELYLRDALHQAVRLQQERLNLRIHYEDPELLARDLGGQVVAADLVEDRSAYSYANEAQTTVIYEVDIDIRVTNGNRETRLSQCNWTVNLEQAGGQWYVINPSELPLFVNCTN